MSAESCSANGFMEPRESAREAQLRYVSDSSPGIRRVRKGRGFSYYTPDGELIRDERIRERIAALAIPPAWTDVWICPSSNGHLQATGRDDRGRKQYRYHTRWRGVRDQSKYDRTLEFGNALPVIRTATYKHMRLEGLPREKVVAAVVRLLETTFIRVGNEMYAKDNGSFGLTTLRDDQAAIGTVNVTFEFVGKGGKEHRVTIQDPKLARIVRASRDLPGEVLFQYRDDEGEPHAIRSDDVNAYLRDVTGSEFTAKDFRTWAGTVLAACELGAMEPARDERSAQSNIAAAIEAVAAKLGNTPAVCRKCYVHPDILDAYADGRLRKAFSRHRAKRSDLSGGLTRPAEAAVLSCLESRRVTVS